MMSTLEARSSVMRRPGMLGFTNRISPAEFDTLVEHDGTGWTGAHGRSRDLRMLRERKN